LANRKTATPAPQPESRDLPLSYAGKNWVLRFSTRAASRLKDHWNFSTDPEGTPNRRTGDAKLAERLGLVELEDIPIMLWACLRSNHPDVTVEDVEEMVDEFGVTALQPILSKVLEAALPPSAAGQKKTDRPRLSR
jgi:hypothetical protein